MVVWNLSGEKTSFSSGAMLMDESLRDGRLKDSDISDAERMRNYSSICFMASMTPSISLTGTMFAIIWKKRVELLTSVSAPYSSTNSVFHAAAKLSMSDPVGFSGMDDSFGAMKATSSVNVFGAGAIFAEIDEQIF